MQLPEKIKNILCKGLPYINLCDWSDLLFFFKLNEKNLDPWQIMVFKNLNLMCLKKFNQSTWTTEIIPRTNGKKPKIVLNEKPGLNIKPEEIQPQSILKDMIYEQKSK